MTVQYVGGMGGLGIDRPIRKVSGEVTVPKQSF